MLPVTNIVRRIGSLLQADWRWVSRGLLGRGTSRGEQQLDSPPEASGPFNELFLHEPSHTIIQKKSGHMMADVPLCGWDMLDGTLLFAAGDRSGMG